MLQPAMQRARARFPRGLFQPPGSFRFSADALLLAAFILRQCLPEEDGAALLDLGCGCGVVALACLLQAEGLTARGVDIDPDLVAAARANAAALGLALRFKADALDLAAALGAPFASAMGDGSREQPGAYAVVAANMPYRVPGSGRLPRSAARNRALFADEATMPSFMTAAKAAITPEGVFALVYPLDGLGRLLSALAGHGFAAETALPVRMARDGASRVLVRAVRAENPLARPFRQEPELTLRAGSGKAGYTPEALAFCPWLDSNPWEGGISKTE